MNEEMSKDLYERAVKHMPGGVNSPVRAYKAVDRVPRFIASAKGDRITDVDGNEMIDYICSWGPGILGHAHDRVIAKVKEAAEAGLTYGAPTKREVEMAELIYDLIPTMEVSRLVSSGTEAVMSAIRVARGYTGRDKIIKFRGCYHGHSDGLLVKAGSAALTTSVPDSAGVPADYTKNTLVAEYNDCDSVKELFDNNKDEIAAVIVEPVAANMGVVLPRHGFLEFLRDITKEIKVESMKKEIEESEAIIKDRDDFFINMSHELLTPANLLHTSNQFIAHICKGVINRESSGEFANCISVMKRQVDILITLINKIMELSKLEGNYYKNNKGIYNIVSLCEDIIAQLNKYTKYKNINIVFDTEVEEAYVKINPDDMAKAVLTLLSCVVKYSKIKSTINFTVKVKKIKLFYP